MRLSIVVVAVTVVRPLAVEAGRPSKFDRCLATVKNKALQNPTLPLGLTDSQGKTFNLTEYPTKNATGLSYETCVAECDGEQEQFQWAVFSRQFSSWLLPWLALISQLPFGPGDRVDGLQSVFLSIGSPTLAAYSLALTILNSRWVTLRFSRFTYPNVRSAVRALSSLQQSPVRLSDDLAILASLVVLPHNDKWWKELTEWLQYPHTWSISAVSSIAWVVIAYVFTVIDSYKSSDDLRESVNASGQGVGSLWLWLLPIVIGWLQVSPKCDEARLRNAMERANMLAFVATETEVVPARELHHSRAIYLAFTEDDDLRCDERITAPIYNYARLFPWVETVERVADVFSAASQRYHNHESVDPDVPWVSVDPTEIPHERNRIGSRSQLEWYCGVQGGGLLLKGNDSSARRRRWGPNVISRMIVASALALLLTWGTVGAAIVIVFFTPTTGLGCRSASYILFGVLSTLVWIILVCSSLLARFAMTVPHGFNAPKGSSWARPIARRLSNTLRRLGKFIAIFNAMWIVTTCFFQFSNFYDRCYCNSSVFGRRGAAFTIIEIAGDNLNEMKRGWVAGTCLAAGAAATFIGFVITYINPPLPQELR